MTYYLNEELNRIIRLRLSGIRPDDIASMTGRTKGAIEKLLSVIKRKQNLVYPKLTHIDCKYTLQVIEDIAIQTRTKKQYIIAQSLHISPSMVSQLMHKRADMIKIDFKAKDGRF